MAPNLSRTLAVLLRAFATTAVLLALATAALAHASLYAASPADGSLVDAAPATYALTFSEPVSPLSLRIVRPDGTFTALDSFALRENVVEIDAPEGLGHGTHVLTWRVVSADGHPIGGSVVFSIGEPSAQAPVVLETVDWTVRIGLLLSRVSLYVGLFLGVGGLFATRVLLPETAGPNRALPAALALGAAGTISSAGFQGLDAIGVSVVRLSDPLVWQVAFDTSYGRTVAASLVALGLASTGLMSRGRAAAALATLSLLVGGLSLTLSGHASAASPQWLMRPAVFLHAVSIAVWIGALTPLGLSLRRGEPRAVAALRRFSRAIPVFVAILFAAGAALAIVQVETPAALLDTTYGQIFLVKLALLAGLFALVAVNRWRLTGPVAAGDAQATRRLARSIAVETVLALAIFGAASAWRFTPPPRVLAAEAAMPTIAQLQSDRTIAVLWIGPAAVGPVDLVVNVLSRDFEPIEPKEVTVTFAQPAAGIEPFSRKLERGDGMSDWHGRALTIPLSGAWKVRIGVLIDDFAIDRLEGEVHINP